MSDAREEQTHRLVPKLANHEGSWAIVHKNTGVCLKEIFRQDVNIVNSIAWIIEKYAEPYEIITIGDYLTRVNASTNVRTANNLKGNL